LHSGVYNPASNDPPSRPTSLTIATGGYLRVSSLNHRTRDIFQLNDGGRVIAAGRLLGRTLRDSPRANYLLRYMELISYFPVFQA